MKVIEDEGLFILGIKRVHGKRILYDAVKDMCCSAENEKLVKDAKAVSLFVEGNPTVEEVQSIAMCLEDLMNGDAVFRIDTEGTDETDEFVLSVAVYL